MSTVMEAPSEEWLERDAARLAKINVAETGLRPLYRRALDRARAKVGNGQACTTREREILDRLAAL